jgi:hypothetical protein
MALTRRRFLKVSGTAAAFAALGPVARIDGSQARAQTIATSRQRGYLLDTPVFGGELQYFRMPVSEIPARLALCQQAAFSVIQTYVPWNVHEYHRGALDFTGRTHPILPNDHHLDPFDYGDSIGTSGPNEYDLGLKVNTDLESFLGLCRDHGFSVILRPGPFISDEWRNGGLPDWLLETAPPEMFEYGPDGTPLLVSPPWSSPPETAAALGGMSLFYFPSPSYASPYYLSGARGWLAGFAEFVRPWLSTNGGPVVAVQVDDETCYYYHFGAFEVDYNPAMVARYVAATGERPPRAWPLPAEGIASLRPALRWQKFKAQQIGAFLATLAGDLRAAGVDVPITHEMELSLTPPADFAADAAAVLLQPELYPGADGPEAMPLIELTAQSARAAQRNLVNVWSAETQEGDLLLASLLLGEGIIGSIQFNYEKGVPDGAVGASARLGRALHSAGPLLTGARRRADVAIIWDNDLAHAPVDSQQWGFATDVHGVIEHHVPALATLLLRAGYSFDLLDTSAAQREDYRGYRQIFLASADILPRSAQENLLAYVRAGGRLVCWPQPPTLDENLEACTVLADACFNEPSSGFYPEPSQQIEVLGLPVITYLGVRTFSLSPGAKAIATRGGAPCGYERRVGAGRALLLGSWPAAANLPARSGEVLEEQPAPASTSATAQLSVAAALVEKYFGPAAAAQLPAALGEGPIETWIVYAYTNQRRGGTYVLTGGALAYWNGDQVVGVAELTTTPDGTTQVISPVPYCPADRPHVAVLRALVGAPPQLQVSDLRIQARVLDAADGRAATVIANNRWPEDVSFRMSTTVGARRVVLPRRGALTLPAGTGIVLAVDYPLPQGARLVQATAQLLGASAPARSSVALSLWAASAAEVIVSLPGRLTSATLDGKPTGARSAGGRALAFEIDAGEHELVLGWRSSAMRARARRDRRRPRRGAG